MPRNKKLSEYEKGQILAFRNMGTSFRKISRQIGRSDKVVRNFCADPEKYDQNRGGDRPKRLSDRSRRQILNNASNSTKSCMEIRADLNLEVSKSTILRVLQASPNHIHSKLKPAPRLKVSHKLARLEFARSNIGRDWNKVLFIISPTMFHNIPVLRIYNVLTYF